MADDLFDRLLDAAAVVARRAGARSWHATVARAFRRDVTCYDWRLNSLLDDLGVVHRSYPSKSRIPGRVAFANEPKDAPSADVLEAFLGRGGTLIVDGTELFKTLGLEARTTDLDAGPLAVRGPMIDELGLPPEFWADDDATAIAIPDATVRVACADGPLVSAVAHLGGTVVVFATGAYSYDRKSTTEVSVSPRQLATELGVTIGDATDVLANDYRFPRDLFVAEVTMASALGHAVAAGLD